MKTESFVFALVGVFGLVMGPIYGIATDWQEPVGPVGLLLAAGLGFMVAFYFWLTGKRIGYRPDDNLDGNIDEAAGEYGDFTPHSWWPLWLGLTSSIVFLGLAVGWWGLRDRRLLRRLRSRRLGLRALQGSARDVTSRA